MLISTSSFRSITAVTGLILVLALTSADLFAQGRVAFQQTTHNFGDITEGAKPSHVFTFKNEGNRAVTLTGVQVSCGCTTPEWTNTPVAPGGTGQVMVAYDSQGRPGPFRRSVRVTTDGQPESVLLYVEGNVHSVRFARAAVQGNVTFDQDVHRLGSISANGDFPAKVRLQNTGERPVRITGVTTTNPNIKVSYPDRPIFNGDTVELDIVISAGNLEAGSRFDYSVIIDTNDTDQPKKSLRFTGQVAQAASPGR